MNHLPAFEANQLRRFYRVATFEVVAGFSSVASCSCARIASHSCSRIASHMSCPTAAQSISIASITERGLFHPRTKARIVRWRGSGNMSNRVPTPSISASALDETKIPSLAAMHLWSLRLFSIDMAAFFRIRIVDAIGVYSITPPTAIKFPTV
jgi:hypothetical protein